MSESMAGHIPFDERSSLDELASMTREHGRIVRREGVGLTLIAVAGWCGFAEAVFPAHPMAGLLAYAAAWPLGIGIWVLMQRLPLPPGAVVTDPVAGLPGAPGVRELRFSRLAMGVVAVALLALVAFELAIDWTPRSGPAAVALAIVALSLAFLIPRTRGAAGLAAVPCVGVFGRWSGASTSGGRPWDEFFHLMLVGVLAAAFVMAFADVVLARLALRRLETRMARWRERARLGPQPEGGRL